MNRLEKILDLQELFYKSDDLRLGEIRNYLDKYNSSIQQKVSILVCRNSAFEPIASQLELIMQCFDIELEIDFGPYDPQLSSGEVPKKYHFIINFWERDQVSLSNEEATDLISKQNLALTELAEIKIINILISEKQIFPDRFENIISNSFQKDLIDSGRAQFFGNNVSSKYFTKIARKVAFEGLLPYLTNPIKMLVLDLDGTLHSGVLGEDGLSGIETAEEFLTLQRKILELKEKGILLTIVSKNDPDDVDALLEKQYLIKPSDCLFVMASWDSKSKKILEASKNANINTDAIIFLDDNTLELYDALSNLVNPPFLAYAGFGATASTRLLTQHPGLFLLNSSTELNRNQDLRANLAREDLLSQNIPFEDYLASLGVELEVFWNKDIERAAEMSRKTNQFNFALNRYSLLAWQKFVKSGSNVLQMTYRDKFGSSGVILTILTSCNDDDEVEILELLLSCRALGRGLEDYILGEAFAEIMRKYGTKKLLLMYRDGPRNAPAKNWLLRNSYTLSTKEAIDDRQIWIYPLTQKESE